MQALVLLAATMLIFLFANNVTWILPEMFFGFDFPAVWDTLLFGMGLLYLVMLLVLAYWAYNHLTWSWIERTIQRLTKQGAAP
jgi:multisubunit Na+/H+ antiporter MnhB subunit